MQGVISLFCVYKLNANLYVFVVVYKQCLTFYITLRASYKLICSQNFMIYVFSLVCGFSNETDYIALLFSSV